MTPSRLLREPLVHFVLLGCLVWTLDAATGADEDLEIVVTERQVARIAALWERQWRRPPTAEELRSLVDDHVREEILYREALRLGLDEDDTVIRRRLAQKIAFVSEDRAVPAQAPVAELEDFFAAHAERYRRPARLTLRQVPFTRDGAEAAARAALERLPELDDAELSTIGDASMLPRRIASWTRREVAAEFGGVFLDELDATKVGRWQGPVRSAFGLHAVRIDAFTPEQPATLELARREVERDWLEARRREANEAFYAELRERYRVRVETDLPGRVPAEG